MRGSLMCPSRGNPYDGGDVSSQLQDDLLTILEAAGVASSVNDQVVELVAAWERDNVPLGEQPPRANQTDFSPRLAPGPCQGTTFNCDGEWHNGYDGRDPYRERCPLASHPEASPPSPGVEELREATDAVIAAARLMPRRTPAAGGCSTIHNFGIAACDVWALDSALTKLDEALSRVSERSETSS